MQKFLVFIPVVLLAFTMQSAQKVKVMADKSLSTISYDMSHPMHDWTGVSSSLRSAIVCLPNKDSIAQVAVVVKIASFDSDNSNRDSHAMEVTEALKYPNISFASTNVKYTARDTMTVAGKLTFHGVTHNISFTAIKSAKNKKANITGAFELKMTDYGIEPPTLLGIATDDEFKIHFNMFY